MRKLGRITSIKSYKIYVSSSEGCYVMTIAHRDCQVHLVTGGCTGHRYDKECTEWTDSTELLTEGDKAWVHSAPLPSPRDYLSGASINNKIIVSGECIYNRPLQSFIAPLIYGFKNWLTTTCVQGESISVRSISTVFCSLMMMVSRRNGRRLGNWGRRGMPMPPASSTSTRLNRTLAAAESESVVTIIYIYHNLVCLTTDMCFIWK